MRDDSFLSFMFTGNEGINEAQPKKHYKKQKNHGSANNTNLHMSN